MDTPATETDGVITAIQRGGENLATRLGAGWHSYRAERQAQAAAYRAAAPERKAAREATATERQRLASQTIVKTYVGHQRSIRKQIERDAVALAQKGYVIVSQSALPGHHKSVLSVRRTPKDQMIVTFHRDR